MHHINYYKYFNKFVNCLSQLIRRLNYDLCDCPLFLLFLWLHRTHTHTLLFSLSVCSSSTVRPVSCGCSFLRFVFTIQLIIYRLHCIYSYTNSLLFQLVGSFGSIHNRYSRVVMILYSSISGVIVIQLMIHVGFFFSFLWHFPLFIQSICISLNKKENQVTVVEFLLNPMNFVRWSNSRHFI